MKILYTILAFILISSNLRSQITLDNEYNGAAEFAYLEGEFYYVTDYLNNSCAVYGLDHQLVKNINITVPSDWYLNDISFVSTKIFNTDDAIELLVVFYRYIADSDTSGHYEYNTRVINDAGTILLDITKGGYSSIFETKDNGLKLMTYIYDFSDYSFVSQTKIYTLPGEISSVKPTSDVIIKDAYPNPAGESLHIPYTINSSTGNTHLILMNTLGQEIKRITLNQQSNEATLRTSDLPAGQYIYYIEQNGQKIAARKFIVSPSVR